MKLVSTFAVLLVVIPSVLNRALPQDSENSSDASKSSTEKDIDIETTTTVPDLPGGDSNEVSPSSSTEDDSSSSSTSEETVVSSTTRRYKPHVYHHFNDDYDMFLDHLNRTSQVKLEYFDRALKEVEKELRPGTPLMRVVDWALNLFMQVQNNNNNNNARRKSSNNGQSS